MVFTYSPTDDYDQIASINVNTAEQKILTESTTDHEAPSPCPGSPSASFQVLDDDGMWQIGKVDLCGDEEVLTSGTTDKEEPDWSSDDSSIYCVNWLGLTSEIGRVDATTGDYTAVTDSSAIRDNPDVYYDAHQDCNEVVYERTTAPTGPAWGDGRKKRPGNGIFLVKHKRKPHDGQMGAAVRVLALGRAMPSPASAKVHINWSVPREEMVSLKVYNTAGQVARVLHQGMTRPGNYTTVWDGTDAQGRRLAAGVYFYALEADGKRLSRKVVLMAE